MRPQLYAHPFSSYCQKVLIALYENDTPFDFRLLSPETPEVGAALADLWPIQRFPVLVDGDRTLFEATIVIEHLGLHHPGPVRLIPADPDEALEVRMWDRFFDNYVSTPQQKIVFDHMRATDAHDPGGVADARADARHRVPRARRAHGRAHVGGRRTVQHGRLRRGAVPLLCRLVPCRSTRRMRTCARIAPACWRGRRSRGRSTRRARTATSSRSARRTATETSQVAAVAISGGVCWCWTTFQSSCPSRR